MHSIFITYALFVVAASAAPIPLIKTNNEASNRGGNRPHAPGQPEPQRGTGEPRGPRVIATNPNPIDYATGEPIPTHDPVTGAPLEAMEWILEWDDQSSSGSVSPPPDGSTSHTQQVYDPTRAPRPANREQMHQSAHPEPERPGSNPTRVPPQRQSTDDPTSRMPGAFSSSRSGNNPASPQNGAPSTQNAGSSGRAT